MHSGTGAKRSAASLAQSHAEYLLEQTKQNVRQLEGTQMLDPLLCRQLNALLGNATIRPPPEEPAAAASAAPRDKGKELDRRNKWAREILADTSVLPTLVDTALKATAGPFLTDSQRQAIIEIVSMSQERIANAITNPEYQRNTQRFTIDSAKATQMGVTRGWRNVNEQWARAREQNLLKAEERRMERLESKAMQDELRRERESFAGTGADTPGLPAAPPSPVPPASRAPRPVSSAAANANMPPIDQLFIGDSDPSTASVVSLPTQHVLDSADVISQGGAVCTTYSPWPGLVLTCTIVASGYDQEYEGDTDALTDGRRLPPRIGTVPLPPRPAPPPPVPAPPVHHSHVPVDYRPPPPPTRAPPAVSQQAAPPYQLHDVPTSLQPSNLPRRDLPPTPRYM